MCYFSTSAHTRSSEYKYWWSVTGVWVWSCDVQCEIVSMQQMLWVIQPSYKSSVLQSDLVHFWLNSLSDLTHNLNTEAEPDVSQVSLESEVKQTAELNISIRHLNVIRHKIGKYLNTSICLSVCTDKCLEGVWSIMSHTLKSHHITANIYFKNRTGKLLG